MPLYEDTPTTAAEEQVHKGSDGTGRGAFTLVTLLCVDDVIVVGTR